MDSPQESIKTYEKEKTTHIVQDDNNQTMAQDNQTKSSQLFPDRIILLQLLFLKLLAMIYIMAFALIFLQIPLIFGSDGFISINHKLNKYNSIDQPSYSKYLQAPTLFWLSDDIHKEFIRFYPVFAPFPSHENTLYIICLLNIFIACCALIDLKGNLFLRPWAYFIMWFSYLSIYNIGQPFFNTTFDKLLLEIGFLAIFFTVKRIKGSFQTEILDSVVRGLFRWLAFRCIFSIGIEKISNWNSAWWKLSDSSFDITQSYLLGHWSPLLPNENLKAFALFSSTTQLFTPILFFAPIRELRIWSAWIHIVIQVLEICLDYSGLTNLFVILLLLTVVDDHFVLSLVPKFILRAIGVPREVLEIESPNHKNNAFKFLFSLLIIILPFITFYHTVFVQKTENILNSRYLKQNIINTYYVTTPIYSAIIFCLFSVIKSWKSNSQSFVIRTLKTIFAVLFFAFIFFGSLKPFLSSIRSDIQISFSNYNLLTQINEKIEPFHLINSYSLFKVPKAELLIQGSYNNEDWKNYQFKSDSEDLPDLINSLYLQRIVWQMEEATDSTIDNELWLINLLQKLFKGDFYLTDHLMENPFVERLPNYLRIIKFNNDDDITEDYFGSVHKRDKILNEYLAKKEYFKNQTEVERDYHPAEELKILAFVIYLGVINVLFNLIR